MPFSLLGPPRKLNVALWDPSGAGKTYTALGLTHLLGGRVAVVDTEHEASRLYASRFPADAALLEAPFTPERFLEALREVEADGYTTCVFDSLSPEWVGPGGIYGGARDPPVTH
jgi:hypothetical protein